MTEPTERPIDETGRTDTAPLDDRRAADDERVRRAERAMPREPASARAYMPAPRAVTTALPMRRDLVRWGPIVAGLVTALTTLILLSLLAVALGITATRSNSASQGDVVQIGAAVTAAVIGIISFFIGGVVAARTAAVDGRGAGALNGFLVWALGVVLILALAAMGLGAILGAAGDVVGATGIPSVTGPNVSPSQAADIGRNSAIGALISLAVPAIAALLGGAAGARTNLEYAEDVD